MLRPPSIVLFERLFLASVAWALVNTLLLSGRLAAIETPLSGLARLMVIATGVVIGTGLMLTLWWFVARRRSVVARWLTVALAIYTLYSLLSGLLSGSAIGGALGVSVMAGGLLQIAAVLFLFRADARTWFVSHQRYAA